jgi:predicted transcriptional regulator
MPAEVEDILAYCEEYAVRLHKAVLPGRTRARDKTLLQVLCRLMRESKATAFAASERYLSKEANMDRKTVTAALKSLRQHGYLLRVQRDSTTHSWSYALVIDRLPEAEEGDELPNTRITALVEGDFSHDAFHGRAWKPNYRLIYAHLLDNPGRTVAEIAREVRCAYNTAKTAVEWLRAEKMVSIKDKRVYVYDRFIRSDRDLDAIAQSNKTTGRTEERIKTYDLDWHAVKEWRKAQRKVTKAIEEGRVTMVEELEFA